MIDGYDSIEDLADLYPDLDKDGDMMMTMKHFRYQKMLKKWVSLMTTMSMLMKY